MKRNRYRNRLGASRLLRFFLIGGIVSTLCVVYVYIKNKQVLLGRRCAKLEQEISLLQSQIEAVEEDIVGVIGRDSLVERLERGESPLQPIEATRVVVINARGEVVQPGEVVVDRPMNERRVGP